MRVPTELIGCQIARTAFDYQVRIYVNGLSDGGSGCRVDAELVIETPFRLRDAANVWHELDPGTGSTLAPVLDLFQNIIAAVDVDNHGALYLTFTDGTQVLVGPDPKFESWHLSGDGVEGITIGPGGETDWERERPTTTDQQRR